MSSKVRKPRLLDADTECCSAGIDNDRVWIVASDEYGNVSSFTLHNPKRLHSWLGKAIKFLEAKNGK